jgi:hypothetical protein
MEHINWQQKLTNTTAVLKCSFATPTNAPLIYTNTILWYIQMQSNAFVYVKGAFVSIMNVQFNVIKTQGITMSNCSGNRLSFSFDLKQSVAAGCPWSVYNTGMRRITTFQSTTDRIYDSGPIILWYYNIIIFTIVLQLPTVFSTVTRPEESHRL